VRGAIYEISEQCIQRLDKFEGHPTNYNRFKVTVFDEDSEPIYLAVIQQGYRDWRLF